MQPFCMLLAVMMKAESEPEYISSATSAHPFLLPLLKQATSCLKETPVKALATYWA